MNKITLTVKVSMLLLFLAVSGSTIDLYGQEHKYAFHKGETAFDGNDITSYYAGNVKKGSETYSYTHDGVKLLFASAENRDKFKKNPDKYFPAYNGWCAIALTSGTLAKPDYGNYKVQDGKLLFFEVRAFFNGRTAWEKDPDINRIVADKKFTEIFVKN